MAIDSVHGRLQGASATKANQKNSIDTNPTPATSKNQTDKIDLTDNTTRISKALESASSLPVVDNERVTAIKHALSNGSYTIDAEKIARKMTQYDSLISRDDTKS